MKQFFKFMFASMLGFFLTFVTIFIILLILCLPFGWWINPVEFLISDQATRSLIICLHGLVHLPDDRIGCD